MGANDQNLEARSAIMAAIRSNLRASAPHDAIRSEHAAHANGRAPGHSTSAALDAPGTTVERFQRSLEAVAGQSLVIRDEREAAAAIARILELEQARRVAISDAALVRALVAPVEANVAWVEQASSSDLFTCDAGISSAQWGIAETGTLVLESRHERHRLLSLVPPVHIAILEASRIRVTLGEALSAVRGEDEASPSQTITFITGPSRTSDIELVLAIGVHGPQRLHVVILER